MKLFICSDIHGNFRAFEAVLAVYRSFYPCRFLFLGDSVGYGSHPDAVLDRLMGLPKSRFIMGNHEKALLERGEREYMSLLAATAIEWTERLVKKNYMEWIRDNLEIMHEGRGFTAAHASPLDPLDWGYVYSQYDADELFLKFDFRLCFIGHTHIPKVYTSNNGEMDPVPGEEFRIDPGERYIINPGSVGQPRDGDPRASCCLYDGGRKTIKLVRCEYDAEAEAMDILKAGLPGYFAARLVEGI